MNKTNDILYRFSENWFGYELKDSFESLKDKQYP